MTTTDPTVVVRLGSPGDLLALLPYHLGYVPERSLLVVTLRGTSLFFVGRVDLPPADVPGREAAAAVLAPLARHRVDRAFVITVEDALTADPDDTHAVPGPRRAAPRSWTDLAREVCAGLRRAGVEVDERIVVRDGRWWHPDGTARERRSQRLPAPADVPALAEYVGRGRVPLRHRDELAGLVRAQPSVVLSEAEVDELVGLFREDGPGRRLLRRSAVLAWGRLLEEPEWEDGDGEDPEWEDLGRPPRAADRREPEPTTRDVAVLVASLHDVELRDLVLGWLCPDGATETPPDDAELTWLARALPARDDEDDRALGSGRLVAELTRLCRACPAGRAAPVLGVLGHVAWWHGDGTLARVAVDAALAEDPGYSLAVLLGRLLDLAVPPRHVA